MNDSITQAIGQLTGCLDKIIREQAGELVLHHPRLGLVGGGQLAKMTALTGLRQPLDIDRRPSSAEAGPGLGGSEVWQRFFS